MARNLSEVAVCSIIERMIRKTEDRESAGR